VSGQAVEPRQRRRRARQVERLGRVAPLVVVGICFQEDRQRIRLRGIRRRRSGDRRRLLLGPDEAVPVARNRADVARLARVVVERAPDGADGLGERAVRDDHVAPDRAHDLAAVHGLVAPLDQQHQQVEVPRDQRHVVPAAREAPLVRRQSERAEAVEPRSLWWRRGGHRR
jgi:hypothetical protein